MPDIIQFRNGNQIAHTYDAGGNRVKTTYYTRKSIAPITTSTILCPEDSLSKYNFTSVFFDSNVRYNRYDNSNDLYLDYILNPEGYYRYYTSYDRYPFYYVRDHIGNICQTWVYPDENYKVCVQKMQYYPSGLTWNQQSGAVEHPYRYNGKEFVEQFGLDEYDSKARWYYPAIARTTTMDPLCEKYYDISPYAWCGNNIVRNVDSDGKDVWEFDERGSVVNRIADKTQDAIRMNGVQISFECNSISNVSQDDYQTTFSFRNEEVAASAFKFIADNSGIEYGLVNSSQKSTIITQHFESKVNVNRIIDAAMSNKEVIKSIIHNHPGNSGPSGFGKKPGDKQAFQNIENKLGYQIQTYIYQPETESLWFFTPSNRGNGGLGWNYFYPNQVRIESHVAPSGMYNIKNFFGYKIKL